MRTRSKLGVIAIVLSVLSVLYFGCASTDYVATANDAGAVDGPEASVPLNLGETPDAGPDARTLTQYCPSTECADPFATCPGSHFSCDVNIKSDRHNCGACGAACPNGWNGRSYCASGKCALNCALGAADCNGIVDDGCEVQFGSNNNCNGCGDRCLDPAKPCVWDDIPVLKGQCGCPTGLTLCGAAPAGPRWLLGDCKNLTTDDNNCGACDQKCDPAKGVGCNDAGPPPPHMYYGCGNSECGQLKCKPGYADCDGDLCGNGCETSLLDPANCGKCGNVCNPGQHCARDYRDPSHVLKCICDPGLTFCEAGGATCADTSSDPENCGGCGSICTRNLPHASSVCRFGSCTPACDDGWGDCNGNSIDGCETNLESDPHNCGMCGHVCNGVAGQPCVGGQCSVGPCKGGVR